MPQTRENSLPHFRKNKCRFFRKSTCRLHYTVILTYIGMLTGFIGIVYAFEKNTFGAVICLMIAGFCDMFDGTIASTK